MKRNSTPLNHQGLSIEKRGGGMLGGISQEKPGFLGWKCAGFTLLELMVVMSIIAVLAAVLFMGTTEEEKTLLLRNTAHQLAQDLRRAQELTMAAESFTCLGGNETRVFGLSFGSFAMAGWEKKYHLFAFCGDLDAGDTAYDPVRDKEILTVTFPKEIKACDVIIQGQPALSRADILFEPPHPFVYLNGMRAGKNMVITLCFKSDISKTRNVMINTAGKIEVK